MHLIRGIFPLLAGEEVLEVFGSFLFVALHPGSQEQLTDLRDTSFLRTRDSLEISSDLRIDSNP